MEHEVLLGYISNSCFHITRSTGLGLPKAKWVKLNCLHSGIGYYCLSMHKLVLTLSLNYDCGATDQTADNIIFTSAPQGISSLMVLNDETGSGLNTFAVNIYINMHLSPQLTLIQQHMQILLVLAFLQYTHKINLPNSAGAIFFHNCGCTIFKHYPRFM